MKILIVDDNANMRSMIRGMVEEWGHDARECSDGTSAVGIYCGYYPDMVLMDIEMDSMDGITATKLIRRVDPNARIIIVTQYDDNDIREEAKKAGVEDFILKENLLQVRTKLQKSIH